MIDINLQLVREFFELNLFHTLTHWQHEAPKPATPETGPLLFVENLHPTQPLQQPDFILRANTIPALHRAVVEVRAWHGDRFYASNLDTSPGLAQFVSPDAINFARYIFGTPDFTSILVISELPASPEHRARALQRLQETGIGHLIEFPTILGDILDRISAHEPYASPTLQMLRLVKRYRFVRRQQLEFPFSTEAPPRPTGATPPETIAPAFTPEDDG